MDGMTGAVSISYDDYQSVAFSKPRSPHACVQCDQISSLIFINFSKWDCNPFRLSTTIIKLIFRCYAIFVKLMWFFFAVLLYKDGFVYKNYTINGPPGWRWASTGPNFLARFWLTELTNCNFFSLELLEVKSSDEAGRVTEKRIKSSQNELARPTLI